MRGVYILTK